MRMQFPPNHHLYHQNPGSNTNISYDLTDVTPPTNIHLSTPTTLSLLPLALQHRRYQTRQLAFPLTSPWRLSYPSP